MGLGLGLGFGFKVGVGVQGRVRARVRISVRVQAGVRAVVLLGVAGVLAARGDLARQALQVLLPNEKGEWVSEWGEGW